MNVYEKIEDLLIRDVKDKTLKLLSEHTYHCEGTLTQRELPDDDYLVVEFNCDLCQGFFYSIPRKKQNERKK